MDNMECIPTIEHAANATESEIHHVIMDSFANTGEWCSLAFNNGAHDLQTLAICSSMIYIVVPLFIGLLTMLYAGLKTKAHVLKVRRQYLEEAESDRGE